MTGREAEINAQVSEYDARTCVSDDVADMSDANGV